MGARLQNIEKRAEMKLKGLLKRVFSYKFNSLLFEYFIIISAIVIIPLSILSFVYYGYYSTSLQQELEGSNKHTALKVRDITDMVFSETRQLLVQLCINRDLEQIVRYNSKLFPDYDAINRYTSLVSSFGMTTLTSRYIHSISVFSIPNNYVFSSLYGGSERQYYVDNGWIDKSIGMAATGNFYTESRAINDASGQTDIISYNGYNPLDEDHKNGIISINIDIGQLINLITSVNDNYFEKVFISDSDNNIILSTDYDYNTHEDSFFSSAVRQINENKTDSSIIDSNGTRYVATFIESEYSDFSYLFATPVDIFEVKLLNLRRFMLLALLLGVVFSLTLAYLMSLRVYRPIRNIRNIIDEDIHLSDEYKTKRKDEFNYIIDNMKRTFKLSHDVEKELKYRIELLDKAKAAALQSHINPHFLCNTLETVNFMALRELDEDNEISKMVLSLSSLLRQSLETENAFTTLKDEVEHSKEYINIQKYRYNDKFSVDWCIDRNCLDLKVIKIMIQPLLENSIYHGIKPMDAKGLITVAAFTKSKNLIIEVEDNGVGMDAKSIIMINEDMHKEYIQRNTHIGLMNVNQRVKILFGDSYGMKVSKRDMGSGIKVSLTLPIISEMNS